MDKYFHAISLKSIRELSRAKDLIRALSFFDQQQQLGKSTEGILNSDKYKDLVIKLENFESNEKTKDLAANVLVEILNLLLLDQCFLNRVFDSEEKDIYHKFEEYRHHIHFVGSGILKLTVSKSNSLTTNVFKLVDKCNRLEEEKNVISSGLAEREAKVEQELSKVKSFLQNITKEIKDEKEKIRIKEDALDSELKSTLDSICASHQQEMESLFNEHEEIQEMLEETSRKHECEIDQVSNEIEMLQEELNQRKEAHENAKEALRDQIEDLSTTIDNSSTELNILNQKLSLLQRNDEIENKEKQMLQKVANLEAEANRIIFHAASRIQSICRGIQDRNRVRALRKKRKKKGKKSKTK